MTNCDMLFESGHFILSKNKNVIALYFIVYKIILITHISVKTIKETGTQFKIRDLLKLEFN